MIRPSMAEINHVGKSHHKTLDDHVHRSVVVYVGFVESSTPSSLSSTKFHISQGHDLVSICPYPQLNHVGSLYFHQLGWVITFGRWPIS